MCEFAPQLFQSCALSPSCILNLGTDRGNVAKLKDCHVQSDFLQANTVNVTTSMNFPDGGLHMLTAPGGGTSIVAIPGLVNDTFTLKSIVAGTDITLTPSNDTLEISAAGASAIVLQSAGGQTLVNDGTGPVLKIAGLDGAAILLSSGGGAVTIAIDPTVPTASGSSIMGPAPFQFKGTGDSDLLQDVSTATEMRWDNQCFRVRDSAGNLAPLVNGATAAGDGGVAIGTSADSEGTRAVSIGASSLAMNTNCVAIGGGASAKNGNGPVAIGTGCDARNQAAVAIGSNCLAQQAGGGAIGQNVSVTPLSSLGIGRNISVTNSNTVAIGNAASSTFDQVIAIGRDSFVNEGYSMAIGVGAEANSYNCTAIGPYAQTGAQPYHHLIGTGVSGAQPFFVEELLGPTVVMGTRVDANTQHAYGAFTPTVAYLMGSLWDFHNFIIVPDPNPDDFYVPTAASMPGTLFSLNAPTTLTRFILPPLADFLALCQSWGLVTGLIIPDEQRGFTFFINNNTGGPVTLEYDNTMFTVIDNNGNTWAANTGFPNLPDGNVHMFVMRPLGNADPIPGRMRIIHYGGLNQANLT